MSLWLKRQQPIQLYQSSELPFIVLENGVYLCFDNCYATNADKSEHNLSFMAEPHCLVRINTLFYKFNNFPTLIPFEDIITLDHTIVSGKIIKSAAQPQSGLNNISIVTAEYIHDCEDLDSLSEILEQFDENFVLIGDDFKPEVWLLEENSTLINHHDWYRTAVQIAHKICKRKERKYLWSKSLGEVVIDCYGIDSDELNSIHEACNAIGLEDVSVAWCG